MSETLPVDRKSRLQLEPVPLVNEPPAARVTNWDEVCHGFDLQGAVLEAQRCLQCPAKPCMSACPLHNDIPGALRLLEEGLVSDAGALFARTNPFSDICGRICPQERLCEGHCVRANRGEPVHIGRLEAFAAESARFDRSTAIPPIARPSGHRIAVVGGGPAGLAAAETLTLRGHQCTVYDAWPEPGGVMLYGIPSFKLSTEVVRRQVALLRSLGVTFLCNTRIGIDVSFDSLVKDYDAVFLGTGASRARRCAVPGEESAGVYTASEFLIKAKLSPDVLPSQYRRPLDARGPAVIIGGGDTAIDCARTARRLGIAKVTCMYRRSEDEISASHKDRLLAAEEGVEFLFLAQPDAFITDRNARLTALRCRRMTLGEPDVSGRRRPIPAAQEPTFAVDCALAVVALGYEADPGWGRFAPGLCRDRDGLFIVEQGSGRTSMPGVFAGGDNVHGPDLVVTAIADAERAADAIDAYVARQRRTPCLTDAQ